MTLSFLLPVAAAALLCLWRYQLTPLAFHTFVWLCVLIKIALIDLDTMTIPDRYNLALFLLAILQILGFILFADLYGNRGLLSVPGQGDGRGSVLSRYLPFLFSRIQGMLAVSLPMLLADLIVPAGFGGGDIKLMAAAGLFLGWGPILLAAAFAFAAAGVYSLYLLLSGRAGRKDSFAFGPFLCTGLAAAAFLPCSL